MMWECTTKTVRSKALRRLWRRGKSSESGEQSHPKRDSIKSIRGIEAMTRVKRGNVARKRRKKILKLAKGFRGSHSRLFRTANQQVMKALRNAYRDRRKRKRDFRRLWIARINAAARQHGMSYSQLIGSLKKANIQLNRKMLAQMAILDAAGFSKVLELASAARKK
jgi:large subunit ribosomal protein L20